MIETPLDGYMRHIAHANNIILKEVIDKIQNENDKKVYTITESR